MAKCWRIDLNCMHPSYSKEKPVDSSGGARTFQTGDWVYAKNSWGDTRWVLGQVVEVTGPYSYKIELRDGHS